MQSGPEITAILRRASDGDAAAIGELVPLVYDELRRQARQQMTAERPDHTLQPTALVHDAFLRLFDASQQPDFQSRKHFFAAAANAMRRILIDHARGRSRLKRGGDRIQANWVDVEDHPQALPIRPDELLELDDALRKLEESDTQSAALVELRLYAGLSVTDAAEVMGISRSAAYELWNYATSWFAVELGR